ncbi:MAG: ClbS/DfsB family four-helix bundle protein [Alteromonadaceae bacterium]|nr:ClbS/DfsB family four-helix bundle protein [Alteromonadaceae bacterium]
MSSIPKNKEELLCAIRLAYGKLYTDYETIPEELTREKGVEGNIKGTTVSVCDTSHSRLMTSFRDNLINKINIM